MIFNFKRWLNRTKSFRHPKPALSRFVLHNIYLLPVERVHQLIHHYYTWVEQTGDPDQVARVIITLCKFVQTQNDQMLGDAVVGHEVGVAHVALVVGEVDGAELAADFVESYGSIVKHLLIFVVVES